MAQEILFELEDLSIMTYLITNFVLTTKTKTAGVVRGKKVMEEEVKQETNYEGSNIKNNIE